MNDLPHLVPVEEFEHNFHPGASCVCGPVLVDTDVGPALRHWPMAAAFYREPATA